MFFKPQKNMRFIFTVFITVVVISAVFMVASFLLKRPFNLLSRLISVVVLLLCSLFVNNVALSEYTYSLEEHELCISKRQKDKYSVLCRIPYGDIIDISENKDIIRGKKCFNYCQNITAKHKLYLCFSENYENNCVCIDFDGEFAEHLSKRCPVGLR